MNKKIPTIFFAFLFSIILIGFASASLTLGGNSGNLEVYQDDSVSGYFTVTSTENITVTLTNNLPTDLDIDFETGTTVTLTENVPKRIDFTITADKDANDGTKNVIITITNSSGPSPSINYLFSLDVNQALFTSDIDVDDDFDVGDTISIDVDMEANEDIEFTITAEIDGENIDTDIDESLDDGDSETYTLELEIPYKLDEGSYDLIVTIDAEEQDGNGEQTREETFSIDINKEKNKLTFDKIEIASVNPSCGGSLDIRVKVANSGTNDQDATVVSIYNSELGIDMEKTLDINDGETETFLFSTTIPSVSPGSYTIQITAESDDTSVSGSLKLDLKTNCKAPIHDAQIFVIPQTSKVGQETTFTATITNTGDSQETYNVALQNYQTWATLTSITPTQVTLQPGKSQDVTIILKPLSTAATQNTFQVKVSFNDQVKTQDAVLSISSSSGKPITGNTTGFFQELGKNIWLTIIVIVLILIIICLIILLALPKKTSVEPTEARLRRRK